MNEVYKRIIDDNNYNDTLYLENDIIALKEGIKNDVGYIDCLINEVQGSVNSAWVDGRITEEQCDHIYRRYIRMEE